MAEPCSVPLFDPATGTPPPDAVDVQLRLPPSLGVVVDTIARLGPNPGLDALLRAYGRVLTDATAHLVRVCGHVRTPRGVEPAHLAVTDELEATVPGDGRLLLHGHIWIGATAAPVAGGDPAPLDLPSVRRGVARVWDHYLAALVDTTTALGLTWTPSGPGSYLEVVDPPFGAGLREPLHGACPSRHGQRMAPLMADTEYLVLAAALELD